MTRPLLPQQEKILRAALDPKRLPIGCRASAGTGKTHLLTEVFIQLTRNGICKPQEICAVTFSRNAANELEERISQKLPEEKGWENLQLSIFTIHGLCKWILSRWGYHLNLPFDLKITDTYDYEFLVKREIETWLINQSWSKNQNLFQRFPLQDLASLCLKIHLGNQSSWHEVIDSDYSTLFTLWFQEHFNQNHIQLILKDLLQIKEGKTQFEKAVFEHRDKIASLSQACAKQIDFAIYERLHSLFVVILPIPRGNKSKTPLGEQIKLLRSTLKKSQPDTIDPEGFRRCRQIDQNFKELMAALNGHLENFKKTSNVASFNDLESWAYDLLKNFPEVRKIIRGRFPYILLDECQDTNQKQWLIFKYILGDRLHGLFAVGDVKQCLYQFRGADPSAFQDLMEAVTNASGHIFSLENHFRSQKELLNKINILSTELFFKEAPPLIPFDTSDQGTMVHLCSKENSSEAEMCVQKCLKLQKEDGLGFDQIVILLRNLKNHVKEYSDTFERYHVPLYIDSGHNFFEHPVTQLFCHFLKWNIDPTDHLSLFHILQSNIFKDLPLETFLRIRDQGFQTDESISLTFLREGHHLTGHNLLTYFQQSQPFMDWIDQAPLPRQEALRFKILSRIFREFVPDACLSHDQGFVQYIDECCRKGEQQRLPLSPRGAVTLMTVHAAKGLQTDVVLIPQLYELPLRTSTEQDLTGSQFYCLRDRKNNGSSRDTIASILFKENDHQEQLEENRRIFYVAMTRARKKVVFVDSQKKSEPHEHAWINFIDSHYKTEVTPLVPQGGDISPNLNSDRVQRKSAPNPIKHSWTVTEISNALCGEKSMAGQNLVLRDKLRNLESGIEMHMRMEFDRSFEKNFWEPITHQFGLPISWTQAKIFREFTLQFDFSPHRLVGKIDALWKSNHHLMIIDYKSKLDPILKHITYQHPYHLQLGIYAFGLQQLLPGFSISCHLVSVRKKELISWTWEPQSAEKIKLLLSGHFDSRTHHEKTC